MKRSTRSRIGITMAAAVASLAVAVPATAQTPSAASSSLLGDALQGLTNTAGNVSDNLGTTLGGALPSPAGGLVTSATGTVGGLVAGTGTTVSGVVDGAVGGVVDGTVGGLLDTAALDELLRSVAPSDTSGGGTTGDGGSANGGSGVTTPGSGGPVIDGRAPTVKYEVLTKRVRTIARTGKLRLRVRLSEPGVVILAGKLKPGRAIKTRKKAGKRSRARSSRFVPAIRFPATAIGFRRAGRLTLTIQVSKKGQRSLRRVRNAKLSLSSLAADIHRNQERTRTTRTLKR